MIKRVTNLGKGLSTNRREDNLGEYTLPDPTTNHTFFNDFDSFNAAEWVVTETQGGATQAVIDEDGGILSLVNTAADDDVNSVQLLNETFKFEVGKRLFCKIRFSVDDAIQSDIQFGLQNNGTPFGSVDGVFFAKDDGTTGLSLRVQKNSALTDTPVTTLADDTFIDVGFFYDGDSSVSAYVAGIRVASSVVTNLPDDEELTVTLSLRNGEAVGKTLKIDYALVAKER